MTISAIQVLNGYPFKDQTLLEDISFNDEPVVNSVDVIAVTIILRNGEALFAVVPSTKGPKFERN